MTRVARGGGGVFFKRDTSQERDTKRVNVPRERKRLDCASPPVLVRVIVTPDVVAASAVSFSCDLLTTSSPFALRGRKRKGEERNETQTKK